MKDYKKEGCKKLKRIATSDNRSSSWYNVVV